MSLCAAGGERRSGGGRCVRGHRLQSGHVTAGQHPGQQAEHRYTHTNEEEAPQYKNVVNVNVLSLSVRPARSTGSPSAASDEAALRSCLSRLLVVHCSSSSQLLLTLHFLETSLSSRPGLALLLIDSISAFYWLDRCEGGASVTKQEEKLSKCAELLGRLLR